MNETRWRQRRQCIHWLVPLLLTSLLFTDVAITRASAKPRRQTRTAAGEYQTPEPSVMPVHPYGIHVCNRGGALGESRGCIAFPVGSNENRVEVAVQDKSGLPVPAFIQIGSRNSDTWIPFCGSTAAAVKIDPGVEIRVRVFAYRAPNLPTCLGTATTGVVKATFFQS